MPRPAHTLQLGALALTTSSGYLAWQHQWIPAGFLGLGALYLFVLACGRNHYDRKVRERHEQARRAARLDDQTLAEVPAPCCQFWKHSEGRAHGPDCTRPPLARRDTYRLTPTEQAVFEELTAGFDDRSAA
ncbi:hypothetical protein [Streptomyces canus]|uniref:hypothetical protein n=1 Tax=Streptomyces canus TaxID=58343 RepID=UPI0033ABBD69